jgi:BirA family biotin operon repressor/biotin-[acetyl-CoA-carboxylase] ligase
MELIRYVSVASTQDTARQLVLASHRLPFTVLAQTQSRGRGRLGKQWSSAPGGLWLTVALRVPSAESVRQAALVTAFSIGHALQTAAPLEISVKWPNDLLIKRKKICGILAETLVLPGETTLLLGIGVNANNTIDDRVLPRATSLKDELNRSVNTDCLLGVIMTRVDQDIASLAERGFSAFLPWLQSHLALVGETVAIEINDQQEHGRVKGLSETGALLLTDVNGLIREVDAGSIYSW